MCQWHGCRDRVQTPKNLGWGTRPHNFGLHCGLRIAYIHLVYIDLSLRGSCNQVILLLLDTRDIGIQVVLL